jgi:hypothetical protein
VAPACQPPSDGGANVAVVTGAVVSILTSTDFAVSTLPATSVERNRTSWVPSPLTDTGAVYAVHSVAPSTWYSVDATPLPPSSSTADSETDAGPVYQPPTAVPSTVAVVTGAVVSCGSLPVESRK